VAGIEAEQERLLDRLRSLAAVSSVGASAVDYYLRSVSEEDETVVFEAEVKARPTGAGRRPRRPRRGPDRIT
jgi:hypothetical protein